MLSPLTKVLIKIIAKGFYREHSGLLLFLFVTIIIYFFFINVLNQTHLTPDQIILYNSSLVLAFVSNPIMMEIVFISWLIYTIKSWQYVAGQLLAADQQFLFYSSTALNKANQFKSWFLVQLIILLPVVGYGLFALIIGIVFNHYVIPALILLYILLLTAISAVLYVRLVNRLMEADRQPYLLKITQNWRKPFFSLFLYHVFDKLKLAYILTKILSGLTITGLLYFLFDVNQDLRVAGIIILAVITAHTILIYQEHRFKETFMSFFRNLPYHRGRLFIDFSGVFLLLLLPESIWLLTNFNATIAIPALLFGLSTALLFRSLLYWFGLNMRSYLRWIGVLFLLFQLLIMSGFLWVLVPINLAVSYALFYRNYYRYQPVM